jgi:biotin carboxyl carrier protein
MPARPATLTRRLERRKEMAREEVLLPMVGKIMSVEVAAGDSVEEDQQLGSFESMKMEMPVFSPYAGTVVEVKVQKGDVAEADQVFCVIETD